MALTQISLPGWSRQEITMPDIVMNGIPLFSLCVSCKLLAGSSNNCKATSPPTQLTGVVITCTAFQK